MGWKTAQDYTGNPMVPPVYNVTSGSINPINWGQIEDWGLLSIYKYPSSTMLWYPGGSFKRHAFHDRISRWLFHYAPAMFIDGVMTILRRQTFMRKIVDKMTKAIEALQFFTLNQWSWSNTNLKKLQNVLVRSDPESLESFSFDIKSLDWKIFLDHYVLGTRHYVLKNHPNSMDSSRKKLKIFHFLHFIIQLAFVFFI